MTHGLDKRATFQEKNSNHSIFSHIFCIVLCHYKNVSKKLKYKESYSHTWCCSDQFRYLCPKGCVTHLNRLWVLKSKSTLIHPDMCLHNQKGSWIFSNCPHLEKLRCCLSRSEASEPEKTWIMYSRYNSGLIHSSQFAPIVRSYKATITGREYSPHIPPKKQCW
jgi:hypothetical protein